jgi:endonuclease/exonuclease/phosphatase family metal-dependent hydrolase
LKLLKHILRWTNLLLVLATVLAYLAPEVSPARFWPLSFFGLAYPLFLFANIAFAIFWALRRDRYAWFSTACLLLGMGHFNGFFGLRLPASPAQNSTDLTVLTFNVGAFEGYPLAKSKFRKGNKERFASFTKSLEPAPDVVCLQEGKGELAAMSKALGLPHHGQHQRNYLYSRYPILAQGELSFGETTNTCLWADIEAPGGTVRVYNVHLQSNKMSQTANRLATEADLGERRTWRDVRFVLARYKEAVGIRARQAQLVARHMADSPHPVVLCGDLNDPPVSYVYNLISKGLQDSFRERGSGIGSTFAGKLPFLRIDYVLPDRSFKVRQHRILSIGISDHKPVLVTLGR